MRTTEVISASIKSKTVARIRREAKIQKRPISHVIADALDSYISRRDAAKKLTGSNIA